MFNHVNMLAFYRGRKVTKACLGHLDMQENQYVHTARQEEFEVTNIWGLYDETLVGFIVQGELVPQNLEIGFDPI